MTSFDWNSGQITGATPITKSYSNTQNVQRFFKAKCCNSLSSMKFYGMA
jgi:hypothetical protein